MADRVRITDVAPRDGLQNEPATVSTRAKARLVEALCRSGVDEVEVTSFVSPKWIPQLGDAADLLGLITDLRQPGSPLFSALVPNQVGMRRLLDANQRAGTLLIEKASVFAAASETFSQRNTNASIEETLERFVPVIALAKESGLATRGYVSCVVQCPFEGDIAPRQVADVARRLLDLGIDEIDLGDTIGAATPETIRLLLEAVMGVVPAERLVLHLHDTRGEAAACARQAMDMGLRSFDSSAGGLGGCPYASTPQRRAPGNIATATLVQAVRDAGLDCGVDDTALAEASTVASSVLAEAQLSAGGSA